MLHEEKIALMTEMQAYEDGAGKKDIAIANYFRGDYIGLQTLRGVICITVALIILCAGYIFYDLEGFMKNLYQIDLLEYGKNLVINYLVIVVVYALINYVVYAYRYTKAKKNLKGYYGKLKELSSMYSEEL